MESTCILMIKTNLGSHEEQASLKQSLKEILAESCHTAGLFELKLDEAVRALHLGF